MSKRNTFKKTAALTLAMICAFGGAGCDFLPTNTERDLQQVVAKVNISNSLKDDAEYAEHKDSVNRIITEGGLSTEIYKRDLVAYYYSYGYNYVESYGYTYEQTYTLLMNTLVSQKVVTQFAIAYYLENSDKVSEAGWESYLSSNLDSSLSADKQTAMKEVLTLKYFLTENGTDNEEYIKAEYSLKKSLNSTLDSLEDQNITATEENHNHSESRTTPTNVGTEKEDYYPVSNGQLDYDVYTGRNKLADCGAYQDVALDGSTAATRQKAYNSFLANLQEYGLIGKNEDTKDITKVDYYYSELSSSLSQALIAKYFEDGKEAMTDKLTTAYIESKYEEIKNAQEYSAKADPSAFATSMESVADDSFLLYGEANFGFVYNILIPFSTAQKQEYSAEQNRGLTDDQLFTARKEILAKVQAKDLRDSWFDEHDHANHAYEATEGYYDNGKLGEKKYLFFEDNFNNTAKYESLTQYEGKYPYNGKVTKNTETDGHAHEEYEFTPNKMDIDGFIDEMESYINFVLTGNKDAGKAVGAKREGEDKYDATSYVENKVTDYSKFMYYEGKVDLDDVAASNFFNPQTSQYKALSAVNELMFAYSTDTGCLNTYMGYAVSPYQTQFVPEFEYAAQYAVAYAADAGVGKYVVCATDYGWHIIYVSFVYDVDDTGDVYGGYNENDKDVEGTFSNMFYESLKATLASNYQNEIQNEVLNKYSNDKNVTRYTDRYKDLWEKQDA